MINGLDQMLAGLKNQVVPGMREMKAGMDTDGSRTESAYGWPER